jgi:hypothetical protein
VGGDTVEQVTHFKKKLFYFYVSDLGELAAKNNFFGAHALMQC